MKLKKEATYQSIYDCSENWQETIGRFSTLSDVWGRSYNWRLMFWMLEVSANNDQLEHGFRMLYQLVTMRTSADIKGNVVDSVRTACAVAESSGRDPEAIARFLVQAFGNPFKGR